MESNGSIQGFEEFRRYKATLQNCMGSIKKV